MSRHFQSSASEYLTTASAPVTAVPLTMACWYLSYDTTLADDQVLMDLHASTGARFEHSFVLILSAFGGTSFGLIAQASDTASGNASISGALVPWRWQHAAGVFVTATDRRAIRNGWEKATDSTDVIPVGINRTNIGRVAGTTSEAFMWGRIAHAAIWNVALEDAEVSMLAKGALPTSIRGNALQAYWPLNTASAGLEVWNNFNLTPTGTRMAPDPPEMARLKPFARRLPFQTPTGDTLFAQACM